MSSRRTPVADSRLAAGVAVGAGARAPSRHASRGRRARGSGDSRDRGEECARIGGCHHRWTGRLQRGGHHEGHQVSVGLPRLRQEAGRGLPVPGVSAVREGRADQAGRCRDGMKDTRCAVGWRASSPTGLRERQTAQPRERDRRQPCPCGGDSDGLVSVGVAVGPAGLIDEHAQRVPPAMAGATTVHGLAAAMPVQRPTVAGSRCTVSPGTCIL
jgi:hypothetical protein